ncbi:MAG: pyridoxal-phosphate dependent enzyme [Candidatus Eremiobacteraeota bacterium]|nr:pyridoxal-phosphate dependent enzyme [Candidatus Eremiobacteraeota bacterium]
MTPARACVVEIGDIEAAARRLDGVAHRTPIVRSRTLDERSGATVFLKCENLQRMGAFKFRGAYNFLSSLSGAELERGVVAFSSGNHAQGVALAARLFLTTATIVMPADAPAVKVAATRDYGAKIVFYERERSHREEIAQAVAAERAATVVPPFDDPRIVAGAGTAALELLEDARDLDAIVTPVGGGGLIGGTAIAAHGRDRAIEIYGVEPEAGNDFAQSLAAGRPVTIPVPKTIADGLQTTAPSELTFGIARSHVREIVTVTDAELAEAMHFGFERMKLVIEPSGAAALAALLHRRIPGLRGKRVGAILTGGNIDPARYAELIGARPQRTSSDVSGTML